MKDSEFNERVPMVFALNESTSLFNEGNYEKAIELLERVLKQDLSKDFTFSIRFDVWYNLSVNYILTKQYDQAFNAIIKFMKHPEVKQSGYRVFFNEELTESQRKMLMWNYRFKPFKFYMDSSKYKKEFRLFVQELGKQLNQIENDAKEKNYTDVINELNLFKDIILYFAEIEASDVFSKESTTTYIFSDNVLLDIFNKVQELIKQYVNKENESIINSLKEKILESEELIKKEQFSNSYEKLVNILNDYYNYEIGATGSLVTDAVKRYKANQAYKTDENFKKVIDLLNLCQKKEAENEENKRHEVIHKKKEEERKKVEEEFKRRELIRKKQEAELKAEYEKFENLLIKYDLTKIYQLNDRDDAINFLQERGKLETNLFQLYNEKVEEFKKRIITLVIKFYSQYLDFNPFNVDIYYFAPIYSHFLKPSSGIGRGWPPWRDKKVKELEDIFKKIEMIDIDSLINEKLTQIAKETIEFTYDVPRENLYDFLLKNQMGDLNFKILKKEEYTSLIYQYDFLTSTRGVKGKLYLTFDEPNLGSVILKVRNEIQEISKKNLEDMNIMNIGRVYLKNYLDTNLVKIVAKQVQTIVYERSFDDLTMGNYRILQAKLIAIGKDIDKLKTKYFEVKAPFTLTSFNCSECGASLNITSKEEKFIICGHCDTPFLMEWQES